MFSDKLISWYLIHQRSLPWRDTTNPYFIWLSEIILQQTRVDQGMSYYLKFITNYPTIFDLAKADEQTVLNDWQGLGYYSRARNLHATAKYIANELNGVFPSTYDSIIQLKGVGPYTAAAIASFAFNEPKALVDGNVYRFLARYFDNSTPIDSTLGKKEFQVLSDQLLDLNQPALFNQAMMEFGSLQCTPNQPDCINCIFNNDCQSFINQTVSQRPVKEKRTKIRKRYFYYAVFEDEQYIVIIKRLELDIWQHLFEFPLIESATELTIDEVEEIFHKQYQLKPFYSSDVVKHILSHQHIFAQFFHFNSIPAQLYAKRIKKNELINYPLPRLLDRYLNKT